MANFFHHIKTENAPPEKYNCDICLVASYLAGRTNLAFTQLERTNIHKSSVKLIEYTVKFCRKHNMKLIIPLKRDKKKLPGLYKLEIDFFEENFKNEELEYIKKKILEHEFNK